MSSSSPYVAKSFPATSTSADVLTAIDTNVLSDIFRRDPQYYEQSAAALRLALGQGAVVACEMVVWAEIRLPSQAVPMPSAR